MLSSLTSMLPIGSAGPPLPGYHFRVDFGLPGVFMKDVGFQKISGISAKFALEEVKSGGIDADKKWKPVGRIFDDLVLERGMFTGSYLINWFEAQMLTQKKIPIPIIVSLLDNDHFPVYSWFFINAYPIAWETSGFDSMAAGSSGLIVEKITFRYMFYKQTNMSVISSGMKAVAGLL